VAPDFRRHAFYLSLTRLPRFFVRPLSDRNKLQA
jgi:hypothetical protein